MATPRPRSPLIAVDTNVPLDLADDKEHALDALDVVRRRLKPGRILITPTVFQELVFLADGSEAAADREQAKRALHGLAGWGLELVNLVPVGHGIVERIADKLQEAGLLPAEEYNDGLILAEAALLNCAILLSGDAHLRGLDFQRASLELKAFDVEMPVIATPREIVAKFF
ncbi:MAG TPA: type II toxin-antitoxin system VapC family toxin [Verrucomicrobiae bacterium]|nr:type II toxin-antitoxin system VapC family toxin [Verrucomicrobiae bacterium]